MNATHLLCDVYDIGTGLLPQGRAEQGSVFMLDGGTLVLF